MAKSRKRSDAPATQDPERPTSSTTTFDNPAIDNGDDRSRSYDRERVAQRAYELYLARGGSHGADWEDWLTAEREMIGDEPARGHSTREPEE